jgi:hypothetical protein
MLFFCLQRPILARCRGGYTGYKYQEVGDYLGDLLSTDDCFLKNSFNLLHQRI